VIRKELAPEWRCYANISAWARWAGIELSNAVEKRPDRCYFEPSWTMKASVQAMVDRGELHPANYKNHGKTAIAGWREDRMRCAAQVVEHSDGRIEIDFDYWNPRDVIGIAGHLWEVAVNKLGNRKTDPVKISAELRKRGINAPV
jgi:hypothetical protein